MVIIITRIAEPNGIDRRIGAQRIIGATGIDDLGQVAVILRYNVSITIHGVFVLQIGQGCLADEAQTIAFRHKTGVRDRRLIFNRLCQSGVNGLCIRIIKRFERIAVIDTGKQIAATMNIQTTSQRRFPARGVQIVIVSIVHEGRPQRGSQLMASPIGRYTHARRDRRIGIGDLVNGGIIYIVIAVDVDIHGRRHIERTPAQATRLIFRGNAFGNRNIAVTGKIGILRVRSIGCKQGNGKHHQRCAVFHINPRHTDKVVGKSPADAGMN